ncbi:MAG: creatininase family protein [Halodesulfurarchaeum sp.]
MYLGDASWPEVAAAIDDRSVALVPIGSTEQHGPHLPEGTDHIIAERLAREAADRGDHLCTPTLTVGVSPHHRQFPATMWADATAFRRYVESIARNLTYHDLDRIIFVNAHGGNVEPLREVGRRLRDDGTGYAIEWMWDESIPDLVDDLFETNGPHAGPKETAMLMHLQPETVRPELFERARSGGLTDPSSTQRRTHGARTQFDALESSQNGAYGDPTDATAAKGAELFEAAVEQLVALADWLAARSRAELRPPDRIEEADPPS